MGWASGSELFTEVIRAVKPEVSDEKTRRRIYGKLVEAFRDMDWDTLNECLGEDDVYDAIYEEIYGKEDE